MAELHLNQSTKLRFSIRAKKGIDKYPAKAHSQRVAAKLGLEKCLIILQGEKTAYFSNSDQPRPFRQDRYFYYLTGCNEPGCYVTYDTESDKLTLWLPPIDLTRVYYDGRGSTVDEAMELYDIDEAIYLTGNGVKSNLTSLMTSHHDAGGKCLFMRSVTDVVDQPLRVKLKGPGTPGLKLRRAMDSCRAVKDEHEIALIRKANAVSAEAHTNILKRLHSMKSEPEVEGIYVGTCITLGAREQSYGPICGVGSNASQLHYMDNNDKFGESELLLVDAGAEWQCYASDVTRTMPINPKAPGTWQSEEAKAIYSHVEKIQEECISMLRPGQSFLHVTFHSIHMAIDALLELGILKGDHMDIFYNGAAAGLYPHGLGHHLGLEVHDVAPPFTNNGTAKAQFNRTRQAYNHFARSSTKYASKKTLKEIRSFGNDSSLYLPPSRPGDPPLKPGMIVTVEPGIYFNEFVLQEFFLNDPVRSRYFDKEVLKRYMHVGGVRIEDDILITKDGNENLTTAPKGEAMLKVIREGAKTVGG